MVSNTDQQYDLIILGGGLAGLTLARQLLNGRPQTSVLILEKKSFPAPESAFKVGESTVEIGAHYLSEDVGLKKHLVDEQLPKLGLRFFFNDGRDTLAESTEVGTSRFFPAPGFQVDRGRLENYLAGAVQKQGAVLQTEATVKDVDLRSDDDSHRVRYEIGGEQREARAAWVVDASGRRAFLKRKLELGEQLDHNVNAVWFRIGARLQVDDWCNDPEWRARCGKVPQRWLSTNHLLGRGYWVWIIPLATESTSIGIVADPRLHPLSNFNKFESAFEWLREHEPLGAAALEPHKDRLQDFMAIKQIGYGCKQVFSEDRWAMTGEAGVFLDPLYSPGIDYIAIANSMICKLINVERNGESIDRLAPQLQSSFLTLFKDNVLTYQDQYPLFGNPRVMSLKYVWDYALYWSFPALLYFNGKLTDPDFVAGLGKGIEDLRGMNRRMQQFFREWDAVDGDAAADDKGVFVDQFDIKILRQLNAELRDRLEVSELRARFMRNVETLRELMAEITGRASQISPSLSQVGSAAEHRLDGVFEALHI